MSLRFLCWDCGCEFIIPERFAKGPMERNGGKMPCEWCEGLNTEIIASSTSGEDDGGETDEGDELSQLPTPKGSGLELKGESPQVD